MRLSVLDLAPVPSDIGPHQALQNMLELARLADDLGFTRYWLAEHHGSHRLAASVPEVLVSVVAGATTRIRVGSGGVLLRFYSPLKVAEVFSTLTTVYPDRIDLGVGRGRGATEAHGKALGAREASYEDQLLELLAFLAGGFPEDHPYAGIEATPMPDEMPDVWHLSTTESGAKLAAEFGLPFAYSLFYRHDPPEVALKTYRDAFERDRWAPEPQVILAVDVVCAETDKEAARVAFEKEDTDELPTKDLVMVGAVDRIASQLRDLSKRHEVDEIMVTTLINDHEARLQSYRLLAKALL